MRTAASSLCRRAAALIVIAVAAAAPAPRSSAADVPGEFYRGINLNGPPVVIDGRPWEGEGGSNGAANIECHDGRFDDQKIPLVPPTDPQRASMIRSSVWNASGSGKIVVGNVPSGNYLVFLHLWEDNDSQTFTVSLQGKPVAKDVRSGSAGQWQRLGPWPVRVSDGRIELTSLGGHANLSGIEIWKDKGASTPSISTVKAPPPPPPAPPPKTTGKRAGYDWWSFKPVVRPPVPKVNRAEWVRNPIDAFVLERLEKEGLSPSPEADR